MVLAYPFLALLHVIYSLVVASLSLFRHLTRPTPSALNAKRRRIPKHLALVFVADNEFDEQTNEHCIRESIRKAIIWCQQIGITQLSVYDTHGIVLTSIEDIPAFEAQDNNFELDRGRIVYPPTPPLSDYSGSRPLSPQELGHKSFSTLHIPTRGITLDFTQTSFNLILCPQPRENHILLLSIS
ncbi:hypothetical protein BDP27DRAFT_1211028 [Rhodocollybia butyracea]|uniref:Uncharacterized protein n=1 Tax=Rhodocollybia butyracea TaxID=206335 RepID=A0A9P5Q8L0_9AGAR|nr:hypothetical protein BDP27DRAFT_1211028 [Rhodocollybia butyracea]